MTTGSYMTPIYSRSQKYAFGDGGGKTPRLFSSVLSGLLSWGGAVPSYTSNFPRDLLAGGIQQFCFLRPSVVGVMSDERTIQYFKGALVDMSGVMLSAQKSRSYSCKV
ncbi:hypothetical protein TNCV_2784581 [Trichonephila clavipes]|nr:hypothetical protein TNCV_2784581 [Trichonephila clavipes]